MAEPAGLSVLGDDAIALARGFAPDFYLAALLAPRAARTELVALAAFFGDVERIILTVSEPPLAEIRLQWWRDALIGAESGANSGHPVADFLGDGVRAGRLPIALFDDLIEARTFDLYADAVPDEAFVTGYYDKADGGAFRLAAGALGCGHSPPSALIQAAGRLYGATRVHRSMVALRARGRMPFPGLAYEDDARLQAELSLRRDALAVGLTDARLLWRNGPLVERAACLPIALVADYLAILRRPEPASQRRVGVLPLTRVWRLWRAHMGAGI
jgi:15-cis-phytoene synthase